MCGAETLKSSSSSLMGESVKASSCCCSGTNMFLGQVRMALMAASLQHSNLGSFSALTRHLCVAVIATALELLSTYTGSTEQVCARRRAV